MSSYYNGGFVDDVWNYVADDAAVPADGDVIVSLVRWRDERDALAGRSGRIGVVLAPDDEIDADADALGDVSLVSVTFPKFTDGRGYSQARTLRDLYGFDGEIRARGDVLADQIPLMLRCGINAFEVSHAPTLDALKDGTLPGLEHGYQSPVGARFGAKRRGAAVPA